MIECLSSNYKNIKRNRGFTFIEYASHRDAAMALHKLWGQLLWGQPLFVGWATKEKDFDVNKVNLFSVFISIKLQRIYILSYILLLFY